MNLPRTRWLLPIASTFALIGCALQSHPTVMAAGHERAALWDEIGVARAERLPRLDLAALLGTQWLHPGGGATLVLRVWSGAPSLAATLFDGRRGAAGVAAAQARYQHAVAVLESSVRTAAQDVENALTDRVSATDRLTDAGLQPRARVRSHEARPLFHPPEYS
ncbi:TolC family protein [Variovorax guangxiensis]|uniref:Outer membrane protein TolC n=1 Tax=Variovorax guangxiensis TaxID=1775474 RepID=A0A840FW06_9BURK|nr:TolC family protein [Variovorax guangxiensis]MBB4224952.1 outer membrane protein TolC [Variovorax guangxiensis]